MHYHNSLLSVEDIEEAITNSYPFNETIVVEGLFMKSKECGGGWNGGFLKMNSSIMTLSGISSSHIENGKRILCEGIIVPKIDYPKGDLGKIVFIQRLEVKRYIDNEALIQNLKEKHEKPVRIWKNLSKKLKINKPHLCFVTPRKKSCLNDMMTALGAESNNFQITHKTIQYLSSAEKGLDNYCKKICELDKGGYDAICFLSGGRDTRNARNEMSSYGLLHEEKTISTILSMKTPTISAIGHSDEFHIFDLAFDDSVATPSLLGIKLRELALI